MSRSASRRGTTLGTALAALILVALALVSPPAARAGNYLVELVGGKLMTADAYWEENGKVHLQVAAVYLALPRDRVHTIERLGERRRVVWELGANNDPLSVRRAKRAALVKRDRKLSRRFLRRGADRVEAVDRGAAADEIQRLTRRFQRAKRQLREVRRRMEALDDTPGS